jgi:threonine/homoserine/homoserine lactone efflux protein
MAVASDSVWALLAARARDWFGARPQRLDTLSATGGSMMIALGLTLAVRD